MKYFCHNNPLEEQNYMELQKSNIKALECNNINIIRLMIEKGANNWNNGLYYACKGGHMEIVKLMIERGADNVQKF